MLNPDPPGLIIDDVGRTDKPTAGGTADSADKIPCTKGISSNDRKLTVQDFFIDENALDYASLLEMCPSKILIPLMEYQALLNGLLFYDITIY